MSNCIIFIANFRLTIENRPIDERDSARKAESILLAVGIAAYDIFQIYLRNRNVVLIKVDQDNIF